MHDFSKKHILIIDCQTTGTHPKNDHLLQMGWSLFDPTSFEDPIIEKWIFKLPTDYVIPSKIRKMLNISESELLEGFDPQIIFEQFQEALLKLGEQPIVIAHYAQFEHIFLKSLFLTFANTEQLNFTLLCSQRIAKRLMPTLPSHNLKALAGFFKIQNSPKNEVISHVTMTMDIWKQIIPKLISIDITNYDALITWLNTKQQKETSKYYEYNIDRLKRLDISTQPGVYRMLAKDKTILYIGKATSLKSRVNSYFRGVKNRNRRILEMLAQVWDIETIECQTPLEAALLESDEIKQWHPPYNILLKSDDRKLLFYNHEFTKYSEHYDEIFYNGPYRPHDAMAALLILINALQLSESVDFYNELITPETLQYSWQIFCNQYEFANNLIHNKPREFLLMGYKLLNDFETIHGKGTFEKWWIKEKNENPEDELNQELRVAHKISRILLRAAETKRKCRHLKRLFNSNLVIATTQKKLNIVNGIIDNDTPELVNSSIHKTEFNLLHYDRLSILLAAKNKQLVFIC